MDRRLRAARTRNRSFTAGSTLRTVGLLMPVA
jgi:hypothetical protein